MSIMLEKWEGENAEAVLRAQHTLLLGAYAMLEAKGLLPAGDRDALREWALQRHGDGAPPQTAAERQANAVTITAHDFVQDFFEMLER